MKPISPGLIVTPSDRKRESWDDASRGNASWFTLFSSDVTPTTDMSAGIMEIAPNGGVLKPHRHSHAELYHIIEGSGFVTIEGVETVVSPGMTAFIPGHAEHSVRNEAATALKIFYVFPSGRFADVVYRFPGDADY